MSVAVARSWRGREGVPGDGRGNVVVLAGTVSAEPVQRRMPSGDEVTERAVSRELDDAA